MTNLQALFREIEQLDANELQQIEQFVKERRNQVMLNKPSPEQLNAEMTALDNAIDALREGLSEDELTEIVRVMNQEYVNPDDLEAGWLHDENGDAK